MIFAGEGTEEPVVRGRKAGMGVGGVRGVEGEA